MAKKRCFNCMKEYDEIYEVCPYCGYIEGTAPAESFFLNPGEILNRRYIVGTVVEQGGFGIVYRAWDAQMDQMVAMKEYFPSGIVNRLAGGRNVIAYGEKNQETFRKGIKRYLTEARNLAEFSHPDIVSLFGYFEENQTAYLVMEYLTGTSLKEYMEQRGQALDEDDAVHITMHMLDALSEIHSHGIIHRDISPDNIFLCEGNRVKIIDFGAARFSSGELAEVYSTVVKPGYAPAEQYQAKSRQGAFTDIYAVGACMYYMLTGKEPADVMDRMIKDEDILPEPKEINPAIPDYLNGIIIKAMAMNPEDRYQSAEDVIEALKSKQAPLDALSGGIRKSEKGSKKENRKSKIRVRRIIKVVAALAAMLAICIGIVWAVVHHTRLIHLDYDGDILFYVPESREAYYGEIVNDYAINTDQNYVKLVTVSDEEYKDRVQESLESDNGADIFISDTFSDNEMDKTEDVKKYIYKRLGQKYYFLSDYYKKKNNNHRIPMFFMVPFMVENKDLGNRVDHPVSSIDELSLKAPEKKDKKSKKKTVKPALYEVKEDIFDLISPLGPNPDSIVKSGEKSGFSSGKAAFYFTDWEEYYQLIKDGIMKLSILYPSDEVALHARLSDYVSISDIRDMQARMAAEDFVIYMMEHQEFEKKIQPENTLPVNREAIERFADIYELNLEADWDKEDDRKEQFQKYLEHCRLP